MKKSKASLMFAYKIKGKENKRKNIIYSNANLVSWKLYHQYFTSTKLIEFISNCGIPVIIL
jgi:hypothetical protein